MNIDKNGGIEYLDEQALKKAKAAGLISLPMHLNQGINCGNCTFFKTMAAKVGHCTNAKVDVPVTHYQCCNHYDNPGEVKSWENKNV